MDFKDKLFVILTEQYDPLLEDVNDIRKNPPKFTSEQQANNKALFGFVGSIVSKLIRERDLFGKVIGRRHDDNEKLIVKYAATFNIAGNKNYRNCIRLKVNRNDEQRTDVELLTDAVNNTVAIVYRNIGNKERSPINELFNKDGVVKKAFKPFVDELVKQLKMQGGEDVTVKEISTARQRGYVIRFKNVDYSKLKNPGRVMSLVSKTDSIDTTK